jgi:hypothetical protein
MVMKIVYLTDKGIPYEQAEDYFAEAAAWASRQCVSFIDYHVQDVSDHSYTNDFITEYRFHDPKDAVLFQLKWKTD